MSSAGWIGFDLDGTLAEYHGWVDNATIGKPIKPMVEKLKEHLANSDVVRIFTARYHGIGLLDVETGEYLTEEDVCGPIRAWCREHIGQELEITNVKDFSMIMLYDDRCVSVQANTGLMLDANAEKDDTEYPQCPTCIHRGTRGEPCFSCWKGDNHEGIKS